MVKIIKGAEPKIEKEIDKDKALLNALSGLSKDFKSINNLLKDINNNQLKGTKAYEKIHEKLVKNAFQTINKIKATGTKEILNDLKIQEQKIKNEMKQLDLEKKREDKIDRELRKKQNVELFKKRLERYNEEIKSIQEEREKLKKEKSKNRYKENTLYKVGSNIKSQPSSVASSIGLSVATGGLINPVIAKTLGLDKIVTAGVKLAGRTVGNLSSKIYDATVGSMFKNVMDPFKNKKSYVSENIDKGSNVVKKAFGSGWFGAFDKKEGAIAKNEEENNPVVKEQKKTNNILELLKKHVLGKEEKEEKKESGGILGKLLQAIGGFGTILKGAAVAAIPYVVKTFFPKIAKWLDDKFKGFLTGTVGLSKGGAEVVSQLVKDALPGALFGFSVNGLKGAVVGGLLSLAAVNLYRLGEKIGEWVADAVNWVSENPISSLFMSAFGFGSFKILKKGIGKITLSITGLSSKLKDITKSIGLKASGWLSDIGKAVKGTLRKIPKAASKAIDSIKNVASKAKKSLGKKAISKTIGKSLLKKIPVLSAIAGTGFALSRLMEGDTTGAGLEFASGLAGSIPGIGTMASIGMDAYLAKRDMDNNSNNTVVSETDSACKVSKETKPINKSLDTLSKSLKELNAIDFMKIIQSNTKALLVLPTFLAKLLTMPVNRFLFSGDNVSLPNMSGLFSNLMPDLNGGGYGTLGPISNGKNNIIHGIPTTGLKELGLAGNVVSSNSIPYIAEENKESLKNLDKIISGWGYDIVYTSAMGGHKIGTGHWKGNKVDLQLKKNGRPTHLTGEQLYVLKKAGYWGPGTGALGWEPVYGQVGGGHYDLFIGNGSNTGSIQLASNQLKLDTQSMPTAAENQYAAMNMMNETTQATAEAQEVSSGGIMDLLGNISNGVATTAENTTSNINNMFSGLSISSAGSQNQGQSLSFSIPNTNGGAGSSTGSVYQFGDVAKTPILYTL